MLVGVLALQGDFAAHARALKAAGIAAREVRRPADLEGTAGVVLPGGESTTMLTLLEGNGLADALRRGAAAGTPMLATCAGLILLAREVHDPPQPSLGLLDVVVRRNAYGRQLASAVVPLAVEMPDELGTDTMEGVFIRAPRVAATGPGVEVLAVREGSPVLLRQGAILAATFHPELSAGSPVLALYRRMLGGAT